MNAFGSLVLDAIDYRVRNERLLVIAWTCNLPSAHNGQHEWY